MDEDTLKWIIDYLERLDAEGCSIRDAITMLEIELENLQATKIEVIKIE